MKNRPLVDTKGQISVPLAPPKEIDFGEKKRILRVGYYESGAFRFKEIQFNEMNEFEGRDIGIDFSKLVNAVVYKRRTPSPGLPMKVYPEHEHFEKRLWGYQHSYFEAKGNIEPTTSDVNSDGAKLERSAALSSSKDKGLERRVGDEENVAGKSKEFKNELPYVGKGKLTLPDGKKIALSQVNLVQNIPKWKGLRPGDGGFSEVAYFEWPELVQRAEELGANMVAEDRERFYSVRASSLAGIEGYTIADFAKRSAIPSFKISK